MFLYQLVLVVADEKRDEFVDSVRFLSNEIREEQGCLDFRLCRDLNKKGAYCVLGEWKTRQAMETHFMHENFSVLIGAAKVLGEGFEMRIGEILEKGGYQFAQERICLQSGEGRFPKRIYPYTENLLDSERIQRP